MRWLQRLFAASAQIEQTGRLDRVPGANDGDPAQCSVLGLCERERLIAAATEHDAAGCHKKSLALLGPALAAAPNDPELSFAWASTLFDWGRHREALDAYLRAAALGCGREAVPLQIGWCCLQLGDAEQAEAWMRKAIGADPDAMRTHFGLATVLRARGRLDEALACYQRSLEREPKHFQSLAASSGCLLGLGDCAAAEARAQGAIAADREQAIGWVQLAAALDRQGRYDEAIAALVRAECIESTSGEDLDSFVALAIAYKNAGRLQDAIAVLEPNLAHRPSAQGHYAYGLALLGAGRLPEGWNHHEFRWLIEPGRSWRQASHRPAWTGQSLRGKTILLRVEQGYGDAIQFLRYARCVKALGATVLLQVYAELARLAEGCAGVDSVIDIPEVPADFDFHAHLLSLPRVFGTDLSSVPAEVPYFRVDPRRVERWAERLSDDTLRKVGVVWAGSPGLHARDRERSIPLAQLTPVLGVDGVRFYALQKGPAAAEIERAVPQGRAIVDLGAELDDFADTAAVISLLDLVLCVDTSVAHLAGALGKPAWLMLRNPADFRWLEGRDDSPWYPKMRLFRQRRSGDWDDVALRVKAALERWVLADRAESLPRGNPPASASRALVPAARQWPPHGHLPGFSAVAEARVGVLQYLPDEPDAGAAVHWYGEFLQGQIDLLARCIRPGATVMEVAAGVGIHALAVAALVGTAGHLFLYESRPVVRRILKQNLAVNRISNATVMRRSLGGASESAGPSASAAPAAPTGTGSDSLTETLDELQLERLDWLKIDDGAAAPAAFEGASATLWRLRPGLFLACDSSTLPALASRAREFGYRCWRVETPLFNPANFNRRDDDIFNGRSALALLAVPEEAEDRMAFDGCVEVEWPCSLPLASRSRKTRRDGHFAAAV